MLRGSMSPDPATEAQILTKRLLDLIHKANPDAVVLTSGQSPRPVRRHHFGPHELVRIVTANDGEVCKACQEIAQGGPYRYNDAKKTIPHHPFCRCKIAPLRTTDPGWLYQHPRPSVKAYVKHAHAMIFPTKVKRRRRMPQRNAQIIKLLKKKRKFVAPRGGRALKIYRLKKNRKPNGH